MRMEIVSIMTPVSLRHFASSAICIHTASSSRFRIYSLYRLRGFTRFIWKMAFLVPANFKIHWRSSSRASRNWWAIV